jgi:hypothetical protein
MHRRGDYDQNLTLTTLAIEAGDGPPQGQLSRVGPHPFQLVGMHLPEVGALLTRNQDRKIREHGLFNSRDGTAIATHTHEGDLLNVNPSRRHSIV